jgi:hypothetical protein
MSTAKTPTKRTSFQTPTTAVEQPSPAANAVPPPLDSGGIELSATTNGDTTTSENGSAGAVQKPLQKPSKSGRKGGGQPGNESAVRTGIRVWRDKGRLPRRFKSVRRELLADGDLVEAELLQKNGRLTAWEQRLLGDYMRLEGIAKLAERRLTERGHIMSDSEFCTMSAMLKTSTETATKTMGKLGMSNDRDSEPDSWADIHTTHGAADDDPLDDGDQPADAADAACASANGTTVALKDDKPCSI